ncbi:hypothetical protein L218DRAFT_891300, partial [Marasmius fiardii PR-910]
MFLKSRSSATIISQINQIKSKVYDPNRHSLLFTISHPSLLDTIQSFSGEKIGCISSPTQNNIITASIALINNSHSTLFRSTIPGIPKSQVGRSHSTTNNSFNLDNRLTPLPNPSSINTFLYLSDTSPEGLISSLRSSFPSSHQLGLLASSTPFITGRPVTLFHNHEIFDQGAVGVAFHSTSTSEIRLPEDLNPLGEEMIVTSAAGNLIITLDNTNPTRLLLHSIQSAGIDSTSAKAIMFKEEEQFYLAVRDRDEISQIYTITSGDTSRGMIALDTTTALDVGLRVQFYHRTNTYTNSHPLLPLSSPSPISDSENLRISLQVSEHDLESLSEPDHPIVLDGVFHAASENGFVVTTRSKSQSQGIPHTWTCTIPGSRCLTSLTETKQDI